MGAYDVRDTIIMQIRSSRDTVERARELLAHTRARLSERARVVPRTRLGRGRALGRLTLGNEPLGGIGLVALTRCGHWWVYPEPATPEQMHEAARFNLGIACSFCLATWQRATQVHSGGMLTREN